MAERRNHNYRPQLRRSSEGKSPKIVGYAAVFFNAADPGTEYELMRYGKYSCVERLMPGCFDRAVKEDDVRALQNHNADILLGRTISGTLRLSVDSRGLKYEIDPPDTQAARDLMESLKRGDVTGSSFSFDYVSKSVVMESNEDGSERDIIEVRETRLYDVGPVTFPAYTSTTSGLRADERGGPVSSAARLLRAAAVERQCDELFRRAVGGAPSSCRSRREGMRERATAVIAEMEYSAIEQLVLQARREKANGVARRRDI